MVEYQERFYYEDETGKKIPLSRMTRAQCEEVIEHMAVELAYWRRLDDTVAAIMAVEDSQRAEKH